MKNAGPPCPAFFFAAAAERKAAVRRAPDFVPNPAQTQRTAKTEASLRGREPLQNRQEWPIVHSADGREDS